MTNPKLLDHIQGAQDQATMLHGVISAIDHLDNESACANGKTALIHIAGKLASDLKRDLDIVNLPEGSNNG